MDPRHKATDGVAVSSSFLVTRSGLSKGEVRSAAQVSRQPLGSIALLHMPSVSIA